MKVQHARNLALLLILSLLFISSGCNKNPGDSDVGQLIVRITDSPFPINMVDYANVTINKVEVRSVGSDSGSPYITLTDSGFTKTFDLLLLQNGITGDLVQMEIPVGSYDLVRLYVDSAEIKVTEGDVYNMKVPSGSQTGLKMFINPPIEVVGGLSAELLLDFDINRSFVVLGNPATPAGINGFNFKPVIRAINRSEAGRISGFVKAPSDTAIGDATVYTEIGESDTLFATTDSEGFYALIGLEPGTYQVTAQEVLHDSVTVEGLQVVAGNNTQQDFELTPKQ